MAHASVASLMRTVDSLLMSNSPMESLICDHREELCALREKVSSLEVFLNNFEKNNVCREMMDFEVEVKEVANAVECTIQLTLTEILMEQVAGDISTSSREQVEGDIATASRGHSNKGIISSRFFKGISKIWARRKFPKRQQQVAGNIATSSRGHSRTHEKLSDSLQQVGEDIDRVWNESIKIQDKGKQKSKESLVQVFSSSTNDILNVKNNMVGREDQRERLLEDLIRGYSGEPKVIPIVGMGGIGKTTLAKEVYNDSSILSRFDVRAWATLSQQPNIREILLSLLHSTITMDDTVKKKSEADLRDMLQKSLKGKRYLIVLDDIWSSEVWDDMSLCFPSENNNAGSRILLTTRNNEVACYAGSENLSLQMGFMDQDESWDLFKSVAFANEALPSEFVTIGKQIAAKCHGVPLSIIVVAGLLKSKRSIKDWKSVANDVKSFVADDPNEQCSHVLGLSYNHLTSDLKACLLYFVIFPEDTEVPVKDLTRIWMAEGFLNLEKDLDGEAKKCLQELVDRCLVIVSERNRDDTKIRSCKVHDLIYDLCLREIRRGNVFLMKDIVFKGSKRSNATKSFFRSLRFLIDVPSECRHRMQPFKLWTGDEIRNFPYGLYRALLTPGHHHKLADVDNNSHLERTRSIFYSGGARNTTFILEPKLIHFKLLKILYLSDIRIDSFPLQILCLIWLRYLSLRSNWYLEIPPEICRLWNLQTFIVQGPSKVIFPEQIWGLMQLRHLKWGDFVFPNPPSISVDRKENMGFSSIQTVSGLAPQCCTKEVILGIQNVKKLKIRGEYGNYGSFWNLNLVHLHQLESLSLRWFQSDSSIPSAKAFPATLKKLKLEGTKLRWKHLDIIAELPNLEVLMLMYGACVGKKWDPNVTVFTRLKLLLINQSDNQSDLHYWKATNNSFPVLERLFIIDCYNLKEIPVEFADIHSLQLIELVGCTPRVQASAKRIQKEQEDIGNSPVVVHNIAPTAWEARYIRPPLPLSPARPQPCISASCCIGLSPIS